MQSEAVSYAYRVWRREWRGKGKEYVRVVIFIMGEVTSRTDAPGRTQVFWYGRVMIHGR